MAEILIEKAGLLSTIQDCGRVGYQRFGMPVSGAMDIYSLQLANILVGNPAAFAVIEATLIGPEIIFLADGPNISDEFSSHWLVSICGAGMRPFINGNPIPMYEAVRLVCGDRLTFSSLGYGCRAYIAFAGGIDVPLIMGSRSTYLRAGIGGFEGRALKSGDIIGLGKPTNGVPEKNIKSEFENLLKSQIPDYQSDSPIRITLGPESNRLNSKELDTLFSSEYSVTAQSDRMGLRLSGPPIKIDNSSLISSSSAGHDIISAGISPGTIQLPGNGQPIILMADRQTTGGYARIANVASIDLTRVAQLKPGDRIRFEKISVEEAQEEIKRRSSQYLLPLCMD